MRLARALVFSDVHVHAFRQFANYHQGDNSRRLEILSVLKDVLNYAVDRSNGVDLIIIAGDLFHEKSKIDVVSAVETCKLLSDVDLPILIASGNHDQTYSGHSSMEILRGSNRFVDTDFTDFGLRFKAVPYNDFHSISRFVGEVDVLVSHGEVVGLGQDYPVDSDVHLRELMEMFRFSIIGHVHNLQMCVENKVLFPGALIPHNFGEPCNGMFWLVDFNDDGVIVNGNVIPHPVFRTIYIGSDDALIPNVQVFERVEDVEFDNRDYYRVVVSSDGRITLPSEIADRAVVVYEARPSLITNIASEGGVELNPERVVFEYARAFIKDPDSRMGLHTKDLGGWLINNSMEIEEICDRLENVS